MRLFLLSLLFFFGAKNGAGQTNVYHPMPDSNASWCESATWGFCPAVDKYILVIGGDTVMNSQQYHKLYASGNITCQTYPPTFYSDQYRGAFRQDIAQKKVYYVDATGSPEELIYDFNLGVGDTIHNLFFTAIITSIDSVLVGSNYHKRFMTNGYTLSGYLNYVEGVGSNLGLYQLLYQGVEQGSVLHAYSENFMEVYQLDMNGCSVMLNSAEQPKNLQLNVFPNPSQNSFTVKFGKTIVDGKIEIHDMLGNLLISQPVFNQSEFNCENLPAGMFMVTVVDEKGRIANTKIIRCP